MANSTAERLKIEWFHGINLFFESRQGQVFLENYFGPADKRDDVEYKTLLILVEAAIPDDEAWGADEVELRNWLSAHSSSARQTYLIGRFAREDFWDQQAWDTRYKELCETAKNIAITVWQLIDNLKAELEDDVAYERQTPLMPVSDSDLELCAKMPSSMVTMPLEDDPEAQAKVRRYIEELGAEFDGDFRSLSENDTDECALMEEEGTKKRTIYPPPSVPA